MTKKILAFLTGIGPEIMEASFSGSGSSSFKNGALTMKQTRHPFGGAGIDAAGHPLPDETLKACRSRCYSPLPAISSPQYDGASVRPEQGLLALQGTPISMPIFALLRFLTVSSICHLSGGTVLVQTLSWYVVEFTLGIISLKGAKSA